MATALRFAALVMLFVAAIGCGKQEEALVQAARSCGIEGQFAKLDGSTTLSFSLPDEAPASRPRVEASYVKASRLSVAVPEGFDPIAEKEIAALPGAVAGEIDLSLRLVLDPALADNVREAVEAAPGKLQLTISFASNAGDDVCTIDVALVAAPL